MAVITESLYDIVPSDVFGAEPSTDAGYARGTYTLTLTTGDVVNTGRLLKIDEFAKTATLAVAADVFATGAMVTTTRLAVYYGSDLKATGAAGRSNFEISFANDGASPKAVAITRGNGSGQVYEGFLHIGGNATTKANFFHNQTADVQKAIRAKLTQENGFKVVRSTKPAVAI